MQKIKGYDGDGIRVTYDSELCIHAAECVRRLPAVFDPRRRPWIEAGAAPADEIASVVRRCPTGALQYQLAGGHAEAAPPRNELRVTSRGPIHATGDLVILDAERRQVASHTRAALCRCGASRNKPYCDGRHALVGFEDAGTLGEPKARAAGDHDSRELSVRLREDGPLVLEGRFAILGTDEATIEGGSGALCRCGGSKNKPFCDGSHRENGFRAEDPSAG